MSEATQEATPEPKPAPRLVETKASGVQIWEYPDGRRVPRRAKKQKTDEHQEQDEKPAEGFAWGTVALGLALGGVLGGAAWLVIKKQSHTLH